MSHLSLSCFHHATLCRLQIWERMSSWLSAELQCQGWSSNLKPFKKCHWVNIAGPEVDTKKSVVSGTVTLKQYSRSGYCSSKGHPPICVCVKAKSFISQLSKRPGSRENNDWTEQSNFRSCAPRLPDSTSSWRWQTDYISSVCRMQDPLSSSPTLPGSDYSQRRRRGGNQ